MERLEMFEPEELRADLKDACKQLFGVQEDGRIIGIAITRITNRCCEICHAAGTQTGRGQIRFLYDHIERWARDIGCSRMRIMGRRGWLRALEGYRQTGVI